GDPVGQPCPQSAWSRGGRANRGVRCGGAGGGRVDRSAPRAGGRRGAGEGARMAERGRTLTERDRRENARASGRRTRPEAEPRYIAWHISAPLDHHQPKDLAHIFEEDLFRAFTECDSTE